jgi:MFS family permease
LAIPWLAALTLQATPLQMAALLVADVVSAAFASLWLGAWVDRSGKRKVMLITDAARFVLLAFLAAVVWLERVSFALLVVVAAASGVLTMGFELARSAWMAQRVPLEELTRRNSQLSAVASVSETAAFALGGWLFQWLGAALALAVDGLSYALSALCLRGVSETQAVPGEAPARTGWRDSVGEALQGLRTVRDHAALSALASIEALLAFCMALFGTSYMIFVSRDLGLPTGELGMIFALGGLGALLGASLAPWLGQRFGPGRTMAVGLAAMALGSACIPMASGVGWLAIGWLVVHQIVGDAGHTVYSVHDRTVRQTAVPFELLARADAGIRGIGQVATLAGALAGGLIGDTFGTQSVLWLGVAAATAGSVLAWQRLSNPAQRS